MKPSRRQLFRLTGGCLLLQFHPAFAQRERTTGTLLNVPIELAGDWGRMLPGAAQAVLKRMRHACLDGVRLLSDGQPKTIRVDDHTSGNPFVWLHPDPGGVAWVIVDIGQQHWTQLAYQFGHELGHVMANSWRQDAKPAAPCQWLEEAMVEAFSIRGLARLGANWKKDPPFADDNAFGNSIINYHHNILMEYGKLAEDQGGTDDFAGWFATHRGEIEAEALGPHAKAASLTILAEYEQSPDCIEGLGALNRWPGRSGVPIGEYLSLWEASCSELKASAHLPRRLRELLQVG